MCNFNYSWADSSLLGSSSANWISDLQTRSSKQCTAWWHDAQVLRMYRWHRWMLGSDTTIPACWPQGLGPTQRSVCVCRIAPTNLILLAILLARSSKRNSHAEEGVMLLWCLQARISRTWTVSGIWFHVLGQHIITNKKAGSGHLSNK